VLSFAARVVGVRDNPVGSDALTKQLEDFLNSQAQEGWTLRQVFGSCDPSFMLDWYVVLERD
jgi:hypothetical protein